MTDPDSSSKRALAVQTPTAKAPKFEFAISLSQEEVIESFRSDPSVAWAEHGNPDPFPPADAPPFQAWLAPGGQLLLRHAVPAVVEATSPLVCIQFSARPSGGTLVRGSFLRAPPSMIRGERTTKISALVLGSFSILYTAWVGWAATLDIGVWAIAICAVVLWFQNNKPKAQSMQQFGRALWGLVGQKFVPHVLGEADSPFRDRALPRAER